MDEKNIIMGASKKTRVIISKHEKRYYMIASRLAVGRVFGYPEGVTTQPKGYPT